MNKYSKDNFFLNTSDDLTRSAYKVDTKAGPLDNNQINRFETDILLNSKESFDSNNSRINGLQEEIISLKNKLKTVYEKEEEIYKLKLDNESLQKEFKKNELIATDIAKLKEENLKLRDTIDKLHLESMNISSLKQENDMLKQKLSTLEQAENKKITEDNTAEDITEEDITAEDITAEDITARDITAEDITNNVTKLEKEQIHVNISQLKSILYNRLKIYHENHIDELITTYNLEDKKVVDKKLMEKILFEAIHI